MLVIIDVVFTVAVIALALGAVTEFQFRIGHVRPPADRTFMGVGGVLLCGRGLIGAGGGEGNGAGLAGCLFLYPAGIELPGNGDHIHHISAEEQEVVGKSYQREEIEDGEREMKHRQQGQDQIQQSQEPGLHRDDEHDQKLCVGIQRGIGQKQAHIQIISRGPSAEDHAENVDHDHAGEVKQVKLAGAPAVLHGPSQGIVAQEEQGVHQNAAAADIGQRIGQQAPDLPVEDQIAVKA